MADNTESPYHEFARAANARMLDATSVAGKGWIERCFASIVQVLGCASRSLPSRRATLLRMCSTLRFGDILLLLFVALARAVTPVRSLHFS
jgi:hypothetical protein